MTRTMISMIQESKKRTLVSFTMKPTTARRNKSLIKIIKKQNMSPTLSLTKGKTSIAP